MHKAGYRVALFARTNTTIDALAKELDGAKAYTCDVTDPDAMTIAFRAVQEQLGPVDVLLYNAGSGSFGNFDGTSAEQMEQAWRINTQGLFLAAKHVVDGMRKAGSGTIIVTGATASLRGGATFTAFAAAKASQRSLAQSMARHLGGDGIHVALLIVDGVVDLPRTRALFGDRADDFFLKPDDIAQNVVHLVNQPRSAWTFEMDVRPHAEKW